MIHFISGLPRSGSTLIASILNQNPACSASIMSPVGRVVTDAFYAMGPSNEASNFITDANRTDVLHGIFDGFYKNKERQRFVFDNNRRWTANIGLIEKLFPDSRVICCLRSPAAIVDSFERLFQEKPLALSIIYDYQSNTSVYDRVARLLAPQGVIGFAWNGTRSAWFGPHRAKLVPILYDDLCRFTAAVIQDLTKELDLPPHDYDFDRIEQIPGAAQFDQDVNAPGLHTLKPKVVYEPRNFVLPPDLVANLPVPFWQVKEPETGAG